MNLRKACIIKGMEKRIHLLNLALNNEVTPFFLFAFLLLVFMSKHTILQEDIIL